MILGIEIDENECENCGCISDELVDDYCPDCWMDEFSGY